MKMIILRVVSISIANLLIQENCATTLPPQIIISKRTVENNIAFYNCVHVSYRFRNSRIRFVAKRNNIFKTWYSEEKTDNQNMVEHK